MNNPLRPFVVAASAATALFLGCPEARAFDDVSTPAAAGATAAAEPTVAVDAELTATQIELLDLAIGAASALPHEPHIKSRSRTQELVVMTCFELDAPNRAVEYANRIDNWRRGAAYADFAYYSANAGHLKEVEMCLDYAEKVAERAEGWRRDRIRVKIARVRTLLGENEKAAALQSGLVESERGKVAGEDFRRAESIDDATFAAALKAADESAALANFELARNAIASLAELYDREYASVERRTAIETASRSAWTKGKLPIQLRIQALERLADHAIDHQDHAHARTLMDEARAIYDEHDWTAEYGVPIIAGIAKRRGRAGDPAPARSELDEALALYQRDLQTIAGIFRADALRPVAEAFAAIGETDRAIEVYTMAVEVGAENPNGRPRAEDLAKTCCSMVTSGIEPTDALRTRLHAIRAELSAPW